MRQAGDHNPVVPAKILNDTDDAKSLIFKDPGNAFTLVEADLENRPALRQKQSGQCPGKLSVRFQTVCASAEREEGFECAHVRLQRLDHAVSDVRRV